MHSFRKAVCGFVLAVAATMAFGAQNPPAHLTLDSAMMHGFRCIPEALFAPLLFPLLLCYWGCGLSEQLLGPSAVPPFTGDIVQAFGRSGMICIAFWMPWILREIFPTLLLEEEEGEV